MRTNPTSCRAGWCQGGCVLVGWSRWSTSWWCWSTVLGRPSPSCCYLCRCQRNSHCHLCIWRERVRVTRRGEEGGGSAVDTCQYDVRSQPCKIADMTCDFTADPRPNHSELMTTSIFSANSNTNYRSCSSATTSSLLLSFLNMDTSTPLVCPPLPALNLNVELTGVSRECTAGLTNGSSGSRDRGGSGSSSNRGLLHTWPTTWTSFSHITCIIHQSKHVLFAQTTCQ